VNNWSVMLALDATKPLRWYLSLSAYDEVHGEPGGLTLSEGANAVNYGENRNATSRFFDRFRLSRYAIYLINEWDISEDTLFTFRAWWDYCFRFSRRQRGGRLWHSSHGPDLSNKSALRPSNSRPGVLNPAFDTIGSFSIKRMP
jgi:hypothetical protein